MKAHFHYPEEPIDLGDIRVEERTIYMATPNGWSCWMGEFIQPHALLGYPVEHWPFIAKLKLPNGSVNGAHLRALMPTTGAGTTLALWMARLNVWKSMGITYDTPIEMIQALGAWEPSQREASWHQLHQLILMHTQPEARTIKYTDREKGLLTWL
jgi:hypothetical protein